MEKQLQTSDLDLSDDFGVKAIGDGIEESKVAEESKNYSIKKCEKIEAFKVFPPEKEEKRRHRVGKMFTFFLESGSSANLMAHYIGQQKLLQTLN